MGSHWGTGGRSVRKRVDPARVARRYGISAADDVVRAASGLRPGLSGFCPVVVRVTKCYPRGELQARCAMEYDTDKVDEMVMALLFLTMFDKDQ